MASSGSNSVGAKIFVKYYYCSIDDVKTNLMMNSLYPEKNPLRIGVLNTDTMTENMFYGILDTAMRWVNSKINDSVCVPLPLIPNSDQPTIPDEISNAFCHYACYLVRMKTTASLSRENNKFDAGIKVFEDMANESIELFVKNLHRYKYAQASSSPHWSTSEIKHFIKTGIDGVQSGISEEGLVNQTPYGTDTKEMVDRITQDNI